MLLELNFEMDVLIVSSSSNRDCCPLDADYCICIEDILMAVCMLPSVLFCIRTKIDGLSSPAYLFDCNMLWCFEVEFMFMVSSKMMQITRDNVIRTTI